MKLKFLTLFSILALAVSVFAESAMSNITVNLRYTGKNGAAKKFAEEMVSSGERGGKEVRRRDGF